MTAKEICQALESNQNRPERVAVFFREIEDIDQFEPESKSKFKDTTDDATEQLFTELRTTIKQALSPENVFTYQVCSRGVYRCSDSKWLDLQIRWRDKPSKASYLAAFQDDFYTTVKRQIDYHMTKARAKEILYDEVLEHAIQCKTLNARYFPRERLLAQVSGHLCP